MRGRVYVTVGCPSVRPSVVSSSDVLVCCWAQARAANIDRQLSAPPTGYRQIPAGARDASSDMMTAAEQPHSVPHFLEVILNQWRMTANPVLQSRKVLFYLIYCCSGIWFYQIFTASDLFYRVESFAKTHKTEQNYTSTAIITSRIT